LIVKLQDPGGAKYGQDHLLASSVLSGWRGLTAEHRHHPQGEVPSFEPAQLEIAIATKCHPECIVSRTGDRLRQHTRVAPGTIWFCPAGVLEEDIVVSEWHDALHVYLPNERFAQLADERGGAASRPEAVPYVGGIFNEKILRIGRGLLDHLQAPGAAGRVLIDTLSIQLTASVIDNYSGDARKAAAGKERRLDRRRLRRVLDYMTAHLKDDVGLTDLADAASLSPYHFIRVFSDTMGTPPHRYLSRMRIEHAKTLLLLGETPIVQIALACCFSLQSNFTRAFHRATGSTPQAYRLRARGR
jgi:AraC family transcriptional regulator